VKEKRFSQLSRRGQGLDPTLSIRQLWIDPEIIVDVRLDDDVPQRSELALPDFVLASEACRLLAQIEFIEAV
jgi:hypothetical protein